jgi:hypothetical protein
MRAAVQEAAGSSGGFSLVCPRLGWARGWTLPAAFAKPRALGGFPLWQFGRIAQLVEQLTLNQRVQGSSPCAPTKFNESNQQLNLIVPPDVGQRFSAWQHLWQRVKNFG